MNADERAALEKYQEHVKERGIDRFDHGSFYNEESAYTTGFDDGIQHERAKTQELVAALDQALRQWRHYRGECSTDNLDESDHAEAKMFREFQALIEKHEGG